jgi:steroid 5-alpha reductase family enzyme
MLQTILFSVLAVFLYMLVWFIAALIKKDNSIVDIAWGLGFVLIAVVNLWISQTFSGRPLLLTFLIIIWAGRLAGYIFVRNRGKGEDFRYAQFREIWGEKVILKTFINVFMLQGFFMLLIAYPIILVNGTTQRMLNILDCFGLFIWLTGFFFEALGDYQLYKFKRDHTNQGRIMTSGLWKYTRHPNYFGEVTVWWGIFVIAGSAPYGLTAIISPLLVTFLLVKVSGVPMLEKRYKDNLEFMEYARKTSSFIPWFPRA